MYGKSHHCTSDGEDNVAHAETNLHVAEDALRRCAVAEATAEANAKDAKMVYERAIKSQPLESGGYRWRKQSPEEKEAQNRMKILHKKSKRADNELHRATTRFLQAQEQERKARDSLKQMRWNLMDAWRKRIGDERSYSSHENISPRPDRTTLELSIT